MNDEHFNCLLRHFPFSGTSKLASLLQLYVNKGFDVFDNITNSKSIVRKNHWKNSKLTVGKIYHF